MESEERKMIEKLLQISEDNNRMLHKMRREVVVMRFAQIARWIILVIVALVAYLYFLPYLGNLDTAFSVINQFQNTQKSQ